MQNWSLLSIRERPKRREKSLLKCPTITLVPLRELLASSFVVLIARSIVISDCKVHCDQRVNPQDRSEVFRTMKSLARHIRALATSREGSWPFLNTSAGFGACFPKIAANEEK
jgi:hypothetical protein